MTSPWAPRGLKHVVCQRHVDFGRFMGHVCTSVVGLLRLVLGLAQGVHDCDLFNSET